MKQHVRFFLVIFLIIPTSFFAEVPSYERVATCLRTASEHDARLLLNLAYWSYHHSQATITAQHAMAGAFTEMWHAWQNCARTRLNPSTQLPYPECIHSDLHYAAFKQALAQHHRANRIYTHVIESAVTHTIIKNMHINELIASMRLQARHEAAQSLRICLKNVKNSLNHAYEGLRESAQLFYPRKICGAKQRTYAGTAHPAKVQTGVEWDALLEESSDSTIHKNIITDYLLNTVHGVVSDFFVRLDTDFNKVSDRLFGAFISSQDVFNQVWLALETARAAFYRSCFVTIKQVMVDLKYSPGTFYSLFDENGLLLSTARQVSLTIV